MYSSEVYMDSEELRKARSILELFYLAKDHQALLQASEDRSLDPLVSSYASGLLLRPWLPWEAIRGSHQGKPSGEAIRGSHQGRCQLS
jgi:hypothetical protein